MLQPYADLSCNTAPPVFVPSPCGVSRARVYYDTTTRAARKALKSPSLFSGQAQSTRIRALKTCITQVNTSEQAFNQVKRENTTVNDTVELQVPVTKQRYAELSPPLYLSAYTNAVQPDLSILTIDPSENVYTLVNNISGGMNVITVRKFVSNVPVLASPTLNLPDTLVSANLFWRNDILVFAGIFYSTYTYILLYTFDTMLNPILPRTEFIPDVTDPVQYSGQSTYNSYGYIYITLTVPITYIGYKAATVLCVTPDLLNSSITNIQRTYTSVHQCIGDTFGGALITARYSLGMDLVYVKDVAYSCRNTIFTDATLCAMTIVPNSSMLEPNTIFVLGTNGTSLNARVITYLPRTTNFTLEPEIVVTVPWPNSTPYQILGVTLCSSYIITPRLFYTLYLYNPVIPSFQYYVQYGEILLNGTILSSSTVPADSYFPPAGTSIPSPYNIQINSNYRINPTNISQVSANVLAITNGLRLQLFTPSYVQEYPAFETIDISRNYCITKIIYPGCDCPKPPVNNNPPLSSYTRTLDIAICKPIQFSNPPSSEGCAPVYTEPTQYLTVAEGAEPPQGSAAQTIIRKYNRINGIDEICKPIPGRYASTRTARIRTNIVSASDTQYVTTVLPLVQYPFPCPVYGNQTGIPLARKCVPMIDGRPGTG